MPFPITSLTASGELSYNGVRFLNYTSKMGGKVVYSDSGRMVKWVEWTVMVKGYINDGPGNTTDATLKTMRQKLTQPGAVFKYDEKGFGTFVINEGAVWDANWGPKPQLIDYDPIGNSQSAYVTWKCVIHIPECPTATYRRALMMADFTVDHSFDLDGYLTQTISGALEIPLTFKAPASRLVADDADKYRDLIWFPEKPGFIRKSSKYTLSMDRRRLEFSIVDEEIPIPLPEGLTMCNVHHRVKSGKAGFVQWVCDFSGTIRVSPMYPRSVSLARFLMICLDRINFTRGRLGAFRPVAPRGIGAIFGLGGAGIAGGARALIAGGIAGGGVMPILPFRFLPEAGEAIGGAAAGLLAGAGGIRPTIIITDIEIDEDIFGREDKFRLTYTLITGGLADIAEVSGLWKPVTGTSWLNWHKSVRDSHGIRGHSGAGMRIAGTETLIDLCDKKTTSVTDVIQPTSPKTKAEEFPGPPPGIRIDSASGGLDELFPPQTSWLSYKTYFLYNQDGRIVWHEPLDGDTEERQPQTDPTGQWATMGGQQTTQAPNVRAKNTQDIVQRISPPGGFVVIEGVAARLVHEIPVPELLSYEGKAVTEVSRQIAKTDIASYGEVRVHGLAWRLTYKLLETPMHLPTMANPALQINGRA